MIRREMKISLMVTLLVLAGGLVVVRQGGRRLEDARQRHAAQVAEAERAGIHSGDRPPRDKRPAREVREDKETVARNLSRDFIALYRKGGIPQNRIPTPSDPGWSRYLELRDGLLSLDASQLQTFIAGIRESTELRRSAREGLIVTAFIAMADDQPADALRFFTGSPDLAASPQLVETCLFTVISKWGAKDPIAALDWITNGRDSRISKESAMSVFLSGVGKNDPKLAFRIIRERNEGESSIRNVVGGTRTPEERTAGLAALREHLAALGDGEKRDKAMAVGGSVLMGMAINDGFEAGSRWLADAGFTPAEYGILANQISTHFSKIEETGLWVEWMGGNIPAGKADQKIRTLVDRWTRRDHQAAGEWLAAMAADNPARTPAVRAYAESIASRDPETAGQWALTLPPGEDRKATVRRIAQNWPRHDEASRAAAEAFLNEHGAR